MKTRTTPRNQKSPVLLLLLCAALLIFVAGCDMATEANDSPSYDKQAEAILLSCNEYEAQTSKERARTLRAMDEVTWYTDNGELKLSDVGNRMGSVEVEDPSAPGSAFVAFCAATGLSVEVYMPPAENDPTLAEALKLRVNDLTGRMHSIGIPGARVIINALYDEGYLVGDAYSAANFAPKVTLQARAIVEEILREENHTGKLSGKIDYQAEGGYFEVLCEVLGIADDKLYSKLEERAGQMLAKIGAEQATQLAYEEEITVLLPGVYSTVNGGELQINADTSYAMMYGMSFSVGSWGFEDGTLLIGDTPAYVDEDGLHIEDIDVPFVKQDADAAEVELTDGENEIYSILDRYNYYLYTQLYVNGWYGTTTDEERVAMAQELLDMFWELDEVHPIKNANDFASLINDSYDYGDRSLSVWEAACEISGVNPAPYDAVFEMVNS